MDLQEAQKIANERKREKMEERLARYVKKSYYVMLLFIYLFVCLLVFNNFFFSMTANL